MGREQYKTPDEDVSAEFNRVCQLFQMALGKPSDRVLFESLMSEASERGLNWVQGLEYVIEHRLTPEMPVITEISARRIPLGTEVGAMESGLRRAG